jgi:hypothetical protein
MRVINVAAAQMGPIQKADSREAVVKRMVALMDEAKAKGAADLCRRLCRRNRRLWNVRSLIGAVASDIGAHDDLDLRWIEDRPARRVSDVHDGANQIDHRIAFHERMVTS